MNSDVLKSLGYLKKSLGMSNRAIANAIKRDPTDKVPDTIQDLINNLIDEISKVDNSIPVIPVVPAIPAIPVVPPASSDNAIDFLVP